MEKQKINKSVSVVIPNYNGKVLLLKYLPYLFNALELSSSVSQWEVLVVDDCSTDDSVSFLKERFPMVRILQNDVNSGFSKTANKGIENARFELLFLLNNDMQVAADYFDVLIPYFKDECLFGVNGALRAATKGNPIAEGLKIPSKSSTKMGYKDDNREGVVGETMYLCGGNALIDRKKTLLIGGFDTGYSPFYYEDMDLSLRAQQKGWKCFYTSETYCIHQHSATINSFYTKDYVSSVFVRNRSLLTYRFAAVWGRMLLLLKISFHAVWDSVCRKQYNPYREALVRIIKGWK